MKTSNILSIIALLIIICGVVISVYLSVIKKNNNENDMTENKYYETTDQFSNQAYNGKTYGQITNNIIDDLIGLKNEFPQLTEISEDARYNLTKGTDNFWVVFQYNNKDTGRIDWSVEMEKYTKPVLPEGKTPFTIDMVPDRTFIGMLGETIVILDFNNGDEKVKDKIINILKNNGAVEKGKEVFIQMPK